ncbi:MAG: hypothetical protein F6K63_14770 [Moorea sp. SIO1G6]|uniref:Uncharacterized protein n=1 Tax=Moorena producens (strain JHB) TaxID=1454205 RepID=A0A1D9FV43_MOOP1|nr:MULTISPECIES: hypothetical protein [Moorena]AOY79248.1 hypothetical protein BJP36_04270 [Moorena producens JHB]NET65578.1 hypothetical protein [Moorena sp. SIO1G6]
MKQPRNTKYSTKNSKLHINKIAPLLSVLLALVCVVALALPVSAHKQPIPKGFTDNFLVLMGTGVVDNNKQPGKPFINCSNGFCDADYFQKVVMKRSNAEIKKLEQLAKDFYYQRFGIDVDDPANSGRIIFRQWLLDPRANYRAYVAAGQQVPPEGWFFYDGGWVVQVIDPEGYTLGGEWNGFHTEPNTLIFFGNYQFLKTNRSGKVVNRFNIFYRAGGPMNFDTRGEASFRCELSLDGQDFPTGVQGQAQGITSLTPISDHEVKFNIRNVITFGPATLQPGFGPDNISGPVPLIRHRGRYR